MLILVSALTLNTAHASELTVTISWNPSEVKHGESSTLTWNSSNAATCELNDKPNAIRGTWVGNNRTNSLSSTLKCFDVNGSAISATAQLIVRKLPTATIKWEPSEIAHGESSLLTWHSTDATTCLMNGQSRATSGSWLAKNRVNSQSVSLKCTGVAGSSSTQTAELTVRKPPTVDIKWLPSEVAHGESAILSWSSTDATYCLINGQERAPNGNWLGKNRTSTQHVSLQCKGLAGESEVKTATLTVRKKPTVSIAWTPAEVAYGESATLTWHSEDATSCDVNGQPRSTSGSWVGSNRTSNQTTTITCTGLAGTSDAVVANLTVHQKPTLALSLSPKTACLNSPQSFSWISHNATNCHNATGEQIGLSGNRQIDTGFVQNGLTQLTCTGKGGTVTSSAEFNVITCHSQPTIERLKVFNNDVEVFSSDDVQPVSEISHPSILLSEPSLLTIELTTNENENTSCELNSSNTFSKTSNVHSISIMPAYLSEEITISCHSPTANSTTKKLIINATDLPLLSAVSTYLSQPLKVGITIEDNDYTDPYAGYRLSSYYSQIHNLFSRSELYEQSDVFNLTNLQTDQLAEYLINTSEAYFEPCGDLAEKQLVPPYTQCRYKNKIGNEPYYRWTSPAYSDNNGEFYTNHWHYEWRATAGISKAIKTLLKKHAQTVNCPAATTDKPSDYINELSTISTSFSFNIRCRAENVRKLIAEQVWQKWSNEAYLATLGSSWMAIQKSNVPHFIARANIVEDMLISTAYPNFDIYNANENSSYQLSDAFTMLTAGETANITCRTTEGETCYWRNTNEPFHVTNSTDLNHSVDTVLALNSSSNELYCDRNGCLNLALLANTLDQVTWNQNIRQFDWFLNGYCINNHVQTNNGPLDSQTDKEKMESFCADYWNLPPSNVSLQGWVELAKYNRNLMIKMRSLPLNQAYIIPLYLSLLNQ